VAGARSASRPHPRIHEAVSVLCWSIALALALALASYRATDPTWFTRQSAAQPIENRIGRVGATSAEAALQLFGTGAYILPFGLAALGWSVFRRRKAAVRPGPWRLAGYAAIAVLVLALAELLFGEIAIDGQRFLPGGYVGLRAAAALAALFAPTGAILVAGTTILGLTTLLSRFSIARSAELVHGASTPALGLIGRALAAARRRAAERRRAKPAAPVAPAAPEPAPAARPAVRPSIRFESRAPEAPDAEPPVPAVAQRAVPPPRPRQSRLPMDQGQRGYTLPSLDLLAPPEPQDREEEKELLERARMMTEKFREFDLSGSVVAIHPGPVVTTFEYKPDAGVKYSKLTGMHDDLGLALKAESVRIDRLPGRSTVGIEVPNRRQETIFPRELLDSERYRASRSKLKLALGKDIHGEVQVAELDRMPHLLIAGATGAGKSVALNGMIVSLLYASTPDDLRFIMIDTKMIELGIYAEIPHLLIPVVTEPKHASAALQWAVREMESRYRRLAAVGVRNIAQFNTLLAEEPGRTMDDGRGGEPVPLQHMPYIVIVIDEMADLMMVSSADVEESIMRLAQMARAVGIHLILATQRPSVDVITGTIKANFPSRIAFRVSQRVDSRTIIDQQGAERLLGRGDMLFLPTGSARVQRLHSGYITEPEIHRITAFLKKTAAPVYDPTILEEPHEARAGAVDEDRDEMFFDAVRTVVTEGKCSITLIQRRLQLGYARAARIVDMMEREGVVSPGEGSKPREVLVGPEYLESLAAQR
jgi:DNA segregation ATPase FtsK/SpoIIIE, S-DNA-T family